MTSHGVNGVPGVFFKWEPRCRADIVLTLSYEISPMKVIHTESRQSFAHFLTSSVLHSAIYRLRQTQR